jgi:hypothetical protein
LARADIALYTAKLQGRNRVEANCPGADESTPAFTRKIQRLGLES